MRIAASGGGSCCCIFLRQRIISKGSDMLDETMAHYHERQGGKKKKHQHSVGAYLFWRASCRIRTNDPEITNHVLWPTELKRQVGKLSTSRRYNLLPLLRSRPGGIDRELAV